MSEFEQVTAEYRVARAEWLESMRWCGKEAWDRRKEVILRRKRINAVADKLWALRDIDARRKAFDAGVSL